MVDGGSNDGTVEWAQENGYETYVQKQKGFRHAYEEVWPLIEGDVVVTFSPDGNSVTGLLPDLISMMRDGYDIDRVRYLEGAKSYDDDVVTAFEIGCSQDCKFPSWGRYTDAMVIYRAKRAGQRARLIGESAFWLPEKLFNTKISWEPLLSVRAAKARLKIGEMPGDEPERIGGERKLKVLQWGGAYYFQFIREIWFWKPGQRK